MFMFFLSWCSELVFLLVLHLRPDRGQFKKKCLLKMCGVNGVYLKCTGLLHLALAHIIKLAL